MLDHDLLTVLHDGVVLTLAGAITSAYFLFRRGMSIGQVRKLLLADTLAALALLLIFIIDLVQRFANPDYHSRLLLLFIVAISFCYPSRLFYRWRRSLRQGRAPIISIQQQIRVIWLLRGSLLLLALLPLLTRLATA